MSENQLKLDADTSIEAFAEKKIVANFSIPQKFATNLNTREDALKDPGAHFDILANVDIG